MALKPFRVTDMRAIGVLAPQTGDITPPTTPQNVTATAINAGRVDVSWTASTDDFGVTGYQVFRNGSPKTTTTSTSYSDTTVQPSTAYSYIIVAFDAAGNNSVASNAANATTPANAAPVWQTIPSQTLIVGNSYLLTLTDYCTDADLDTLTFSLISGTLPTGLSLSGSRIQGTPTTAGQTPTVTIRASDVFHSIDTTISFTSYTADVTAPPVPTGLSATAISSSQINLSWSASTDAAGSANEYVSGTQDYRIYRDGVLRATTSSTSYSDTGLSASTLYAYRITARDVSLNESAQTSQVTATTSADTGPLTVSIAASRTSGPAPLAVFFDCTGSTHTAANAFREIGYYADYGDPGSGTWTHSGQSKNIDKGAPLFAHVFETPGLYTVKVRGLDSSSNVDQDEVTITVTDPDSVYSGTNTVCISRTTDTTGSPAGAQLLTNQTSWPTFSSNKRYLLRAGQDFSSFGSISLNQKSDIIVGSFGSGADPIVSGVTVESSSDSNPPSSYGSNKVVMDLSMPSGRVDASGSAHEILLLRLYIGAPGSGHGISIGTLLDYYFNGGGASKLTTAQRNAIEWAKNVFAVECEVAAGDTCNVFNSGGRGSHFLGCTMYGPVEHNLRSPTNYKAVIAHNWFYAVTDAIRHNVKLHSKGIADAEPVFLSQENDPDTRYVTIRKNKILNASGTDNNQWSVVPSPQSGSFTEGVRDVIIEENEWQKNAVSAEIAWWGIDIVQRGNTMVTGTLNIATNTSAGANTPGWNGPYHQSTSQIATSAPV